MNLISGNYEFASLIVINDEGFWSQHGGQGEANWEVLLVDGNFVVHLTEGSAELTQQGDYAAWGPGIAHS